ISTPARTCRRTRCRRRRAPAADARGARRGSRARAGLLRVRRRASPAGGPEPSARVSTAIETRVPPDFAADVRALRTAADGAAEVQHDEIGRASCRERVANPVVVEADITN